VPLPELGLLLTASGDGTVLLSALSLVLGGTLVDAGGGGGGASGATATAYGRPLSPTTGGGGGGAAGGGGGVSALERSLVGATVPVPLERLAANAAKLVELAGSLASVRSDAEYAAFRAAQALREALTRAESELAAAKAALEAREAELQAERLAAVHKEQDIVKVRCTHRASLSRPMRR
jgi:hypothetical protein